jgi:NADPH:quinone reductase
MPTVSLYIALVRRPHGVPTADDFALREEALAPLRPGEALVQNLYISVDPYMRGRMRDVPSHMGPFPLNEVITGSTVGRVVESNNDSLPIDAVVTSFSGWRDTFVTDGSDVDVIESNGTPLPAHLGILGMPGFTGWYGLHEIGAPQAGETVLVSAAAGAVGSVVTQLARRRGCRVVGVVGSDQKARYITDDLGADAALNYRSEPDMTAAVRRACPDGVDVYFDNTGGVILEAALANANLAARMPICGMISTYNAEGGAPGPANLTQIIGSRVTVRGFLIRDHGDRRPEFLAEVAPLVRDGSLHRRETIVEGLEQAPEAFMGLFTGQNIGKMVVSVPWDDA